MILRVHNLSKKHKTMLDAFRHRKCNAIQLSLKLLGEKFTDSKIDLLGLTKSVINQSGDRFQSIFVIDTVSLDG